MPRTLYQPPAWTPLITEKPISRAVYVVSLASAADSTWPSQLWLVGADHGEYRSLPVEQQVGVVALARDGRTVAWTEDGRYGPSTRLRIVDLPTGRLRSIELPGSLRRGLSLDGVAFDPTGNELALWGEDGTGSGAGSSAVVVRLDVRTGRTAQICSQARADGFIGAAWTGAGELLVSGCVPGNPAALPGVRELPPPAVQPLESSPAPPGLVSALPMISADGRVRWAVTTIDQGADAGPVRKAGLSRTNLLVPPISGRRISTAPGPQVSTAPTPGSSGVLADLGQVTGAEGLTVTGRGAVVTRWLADRANGLLGPSSVVLVDPRARVQVLSTVDGDRLRAIAVAADVVSGGSATAGARPRWPGFNPDWWSWLIWSLAQALLRQWFTGWPGWVWVLLGLLVGWRALRRRSRDNGAGPGVNPFARSGFRWRRPPWWLVLRLRPVRSRGLRMAGAVLGLVLVAASAAVLLPARHGQPPARPSAARPGTPVLPRVLRDQSLIPPRAFDQTGRPRTSSVSMLVTGLIAGRQGIYGTDAATATLVRLDDLPGPAHQLQGSAALSPNGRFLSDGVVLADLRQATVRTIAGAPEPAMMASGGGPTTGVAVLDDGTVVSVVRQDRVWLSPPPGSGRAAGPVAGLSVVDSVQAQAGNLLLVTHFNRDGYGDGRPLRDLVDLATTPPTVTELPGLSQTEPVAVDRDILVQHGIDGSLVTLSTSDLTVRQPVPGSPRVSDWLGLVPQSSDETTLVALGTGKTTPLAILRMPVTAVQPTAGPVVKSTAGAGGSTELTRIDLGSPDEVSRVAGQVARITLAPEVIATASMVDVAQQPWWATTPGPYWQAAARSMIGFAVLRLLWLVLRGVRRPRSESTRAQGSMGGE